MNFDSIFQRLNTLSLLATGLSSPNPPVAAVITDTSGNIISEGHTQAVGGNHAEREAYSKLTTIPDHYLFVTLEPCSHTGRTPPCLDLVLTHRPKKVFLGIKDPNPLVRARDSVQTISQNGIDLEFLPELENIALSFLKGFIKRIIKNRPSYILKSALSKEGYFSGKGKETIRLTNSYTDNLMQAFRSRVDAILVGPGTTHRDNPGLDYRGYTPNPLQYFPAPSEPFWKTLLSSVYGENPLPIPETRSQPYRIFCLSSKYPIRGEFIEKQRKINRETNSEKLVFMLLDSLPLLERKKLDMFANASVLEVNANSFVEDLDKLLLSLGVNTLVIEGGNFLYSLYAPLLDQFDQAILIHTPSSIPEGIAPSLSRDLVVQDRVDLQGDVLSVYKKS